MLPSVLGLRAWFIFGTVVVGIGVVEVVVPFRVVVIVEVAFESMVVPLVAGVVGDEELVKFFTLGGYSYLVLGVIKQDEMLLKDRLS